MEDIQWTERQRLEFAINKYQRTNVLPPQASILYKRILNYQTCWLSQESLAKEMGLSVRTIRRWLVFLKEVNLISCRRTNRTNEYSKWADPDRTISSDLDGTKVSHPDRTIVSDPDRTIHVDDKEEIQQQANAAAAVTSPEKPNSIHQLVLLGMPESVRPIAEGNLSLAEAVLAHAFWRFSTGKPVRNKAGYLVACFEKPTSYSFNRDSAGVWHPPKGEFRAAILTPEQRQQTANAAFERWKTLSDADRDLVYDRTEKAFSFYRYLGRNSYTVVSGCVKMMQQMEEEGILL